MQLVTASPSIMQPTPTVLPFSTVARLEMRASSVGGVAGGVGSAGFAETVQRYSAVAPTLPAASTWRTASTWPPSARSLSTTGEAHGDEGTAVERALERRVRLRADVDARAALDRVGGGAGQQRGAAGAVVSTVQCQVAGVASTRPP